MRYRASEMGFHYDNRTKNRPFPKIDLSVKVSPKEVATISIHIENTAVSGLVDLISLYFKREDSLYPSQIGYTKYLQPKMAQADKDTSRVAHFSFKAEKAGVLYATAHCRYLGFFESSQKMRICT